MFDDQDRYEWASVSSSTGSSGLSQSQGHKTVVVVVLEADDIR